MKRSFEDGAAGVWGGKKKRGRPSFCNESPQRGASDHGELFWTGRWVERGSSKDGSDREVRGDIDLCGGPLATRSVL